MCRSAVARADAVRGAERDLTARHRWPRTRSFGAHLVIGDQLLSGLHRTVAPDGTVEMSETDAVPLLRVGGGVRGHELRE